MEKARMGKVWRKFHSILGADLKVAFETTFPKATVLDLLDPLYRESGLVHDSPNETVKRLYEPAIQILGSCLSGDATQIFFEPVSSDSPFFQRLVFVRRIKNTRCWMVAARHGEVAHFGFDSWNRPSERYLPLAYPGKSGQFIPVYFKIQTEGGDFVYLEVWAWSENENTVVQARKVSNRLVPKTLKSAEPGLS